MKIDKSSALVYSTDGGKMCPDCRFPIGNCTCNQKTQGAVSDGVVRVSRETKGRNGKGVTVMKGLALDADALALLGKQLKTACGSGGTVKNGVIELQGDHVISPRPPCLVTTGTSLEIANPSGCARLSGDSNHYPQE